MCNFRNLYVWAAADHVGEVGRSVLGLAGKAALVRIKSCASLCRGHERIHPKFESSHWGHFPQLKAIERQQLAVKRLEGFERFVFKYCHKPCLLLSLNAINECVKRVQIVMC
jgi:hypothetical protein